MSALVPAAPGNLHLHAMEHLAQVIYSGNLLLLVLL